MIYNATLLRIDAQTGMSSGGTPTWTQGLALSVRCSIGSPSQKDIYLDPGLAEVTSVKLQVLRRDLDAALVRASYPPAVPATEQRVLVQGDRGAAATLYRVRSVNSTPSGSESMVELMLMAD